MLLMGSNLVFGENRLRGGMTASEKAYGWTKRKLLHGSFEEGQLLSEGEVAAELGMSRTPVREAFLRLSAEGLLRLYPKRGALVVPVSAQEMFDALEARMTVERFAAEKVISTKAHERAAAEMNQLLSMALERVPNASSVELSDLDRRFHTVLVDAAGNQIVSEWYRSLRDRLLRIASVIFERDPDLRPAILAEHRQMVEHLSSGDLDALVGSIEAHVHGIELHSGAGGGGIAGRDLGAAQRRRA